MSEKKIAGQSVERVIIFALTVCGAIWGVYSTVATKDDVVVVLERVESVSDVHELDKANNALLEISKQELFYEQRDPELPLMEQERLQKKQRDSLKQHYQQKRDALTKKIYGGEK